MLTSHLKGRFGAWRSSELRRLEMQLGNWPDAIAEGDPTLAILERMRAHERRRSEIRAQLEHLDGLHRAGDLGRSPDLLRTLRARLTDWQGYLTRQPDVARQTLRKLLEGRLI